MTRVPFLALSLLVLGLIGGCGQIDEARFGLVQSTALAEDLEQILGVRPSVSSQWSNGVFDELRVTFDQMPIESGVEEITAAVRQLMLVHFDDEPRNLRLSFEETFD